MDNNKKINIMKNSEEGKIVNLEEKSTSNELNKKSESSTSIIISGIINEAYHLKTLSVTKYSSVHNNYNEYSFNKTTTNTNQSNKQSTTKETMKKVATNSIINKISKLEPGSCANSNQYKLSTEKLPSLSRSVSNCIEIAHSNNTILNKYTTSANTVSKDTTASHLLKTPYSLTEKKTNTNYTLNASSKPLTYSCSNQKLIDSGRNNSKNYCNKLKEKTINTNKLVNDNDIQTSNTNIKEAPRAKYFNNFDKLPSLPYSTSILKPTTSRNALTGMHYEPKTVSPFKKLTIDSGKSEILIKQSNYPSYPSKMNVRKNKNPGILYIFNNDKFKDSKKFPDREGSSIDVKLLTETFLRLKVKSELHENYTAAQIGKVIKTIEDTSFSENSCIIFAILSHGGRHNEIAAFDTLYNIHDHIIFPVLRNGTLSEKPKIVIVQSCKGSQNLLSFETDGNKKVPPIPEDILIFYSTYEGYVSFRHNHDGSIFIKTFCEHLDKYGKTMDIGTIMINTINDVKWATKKLQIPTISKNITNPYVFGDHI